MRHWMFQMAALANIVLLLGCVSESDVVCDMDGDAYDEIQDAADSVLARCQVSCAVVQRFQIAKDSIPDYFGFHAAADAFKMGCIEGGDVRILDGGALQSALASSNLCDVAYADGVISSGRLHVGGQEELLAWRESRSTVLQRAFWGRCSHSGNKNESVFRSHLIGNVPEGGGTTGQYVNPYEKCWDEYCRGYNEAIRLFIVTGRFPFLCGYYCDIPGLSENMEERAYVYGWWSGGLNYFGESEWRDCGVHEYRDLSVALHCRSRLEQFLDRERRYLQRFSQEIQKERRLLDAILQTSGR